MHKLYAYTFKYRRISLWMHIYHKPKLIRLAGAVESGCGTNRSLGARGVRVPGRGLPALNWWIFHGKMGSFSFRDFL